MLGKTFSRFKKQKDKPVTPPAPKSPQGVPSLGEVAKMLSASGRVGLANLRKISQEKNKDSFVRFLRKPVLAGDAIQAGRISNQEGGGGEEMNRTQIFEPSGTNPGASPASEALKHAIYPLVKGEYSTTSSRSFTIGRIDGNDMIMPDFAISKKHAVITVENGSYYIKDLGSTNGTMVNGTRLDKKSVKIHDHDVVSFARYEFTFLLPSSLYKMLNA
jgi:pSer/pThr/pTyr-binding forkhead associated (FHA) protein